MNFEMTFIKYILFAVNFVLALSGIGLIVAGACILANDDEFEFFVDPGSKKPPVILIVTGVVVFVMTFLGFYGAIKENYTSLISFALALLVLFFIELALGIVVAVFKDSFSTVLRKSLKDSMTTFTWTEELAWEKLQKTFECCGMDSLKDWLDVNALSHRRSADLPNSCCKDLPFDEICSDKMPRGKKSPFQQGCWAIVESKISNNASTLIGVAIGIAIMQIVGIVFGCCLAMSIKKEMIQDKGRRGKM